MTMNLLNSSLAYCGLVSCTLYCTEHKFGTNSLDGGHICNEVLWDAWRFECSRTYAS